MERARCGKKGMSFTIRTNDKGGGGICGSNAFQDYFDDAKDSSQESRVKQVSRIKESFNQSKFQESKIRSIKIQD